MRTIQQVRMGMMAKVLLILTLLFIPLWWYTGKQEFAIKETTKTKLTYQEAKKKTPHFDYKRGDIYLQRTVWYDKKRTNVPFVYHRDTTDSESKYVFKKH